MRYIVPTTITDAMLVSSSVPEDDHSAWSAAAAYAVGDRVIRTETHSVYERLVAGTTATPPESDAVNWVRVGPTNRWAMLDSAVGTTTDGIDTISVSLRPGVVRGVALLDMSIEAVSVVMTVDGSEVYRRDIDPVGNQEDCDDWYSYFFESIQRRSMLIATDLPPYAEGVITITATGAGPISIGSCVLGAMYSLGDTLTNPTIAITDYSRKEADDYGVVQVAERGYSKRMQLAVVLPTNTVDVATARLARVRARPAVWIGSKAMDSLIVYGFVKDWSVAIPGRVLSTCSLEIEGLV